MITLELDISRRSTLCYPDGEIVPKCPAPNSLGGSGKCGATMLDDSRIGGLKCFACGYELPYGEFNTQSSKF